MAELILVVDDEAAIADLVEVYLSNEGCRVLKCHTAQEALACLRRERPDLAVLDVMLPDMDGFALCRKIREDHFFPIIMLTARVEDMDKITGLTLGADDYITKPFNPLELAARVKTQLRRYTRYNAGEPAPREAEAYGHGAVPAARTLRKAEVRAFAAACLAEGIALRRGGVPGTILILGYTPSEERAS